MVRDTTDVTRAPAADERNRVAVEILSRPGLVTAAEALALAVLTGDLPTRGGE